MRLLKLAMLLVLPLNTLAQFSNDKCKWVKTFGQSFELDSLSVDRNSISVQPSDFVLDYDITTGKAFIKSRPEYDSVRVCYTVFPIAFHQRYFHKDLALYDSGALFKSPASKRLNILQRNQLFDTPELNKSGSISRGISFGNNQDVFVNSTLNLNLDGKLTEDINIRANITDQNVPYQPEGNTQQLQDFDNVLIELYNNRFSLKGGDVVFKNPESHFLRFYKNVQGAQASVNYKLGGSEAVTSAGISVAKGQFSSVQVDAIEGSLGPYRIPGPNNELFVIILANSERVYLDGERLERGFNKDYTIDYNIGEITFTNRVLITEFSRLRIDYEYSDQDFSRTISTVSHQQNFGKLQVEAHTYSESDNRNRPLNFQLSNADQLLLSEVGDAVSQAVTSGADSVAFSPEAVLYAQRDTIDLEGNAVSIFQYSTDASEAFFNVSFSDVGLGNGNYVQIQSTANGRVFEWVSPSNGEPQGDFEPVTPLPVPTQRQMTTLALNYQVNANENVYTELAFSNYDENLFSELDSDDDHGFAFKVGLTSRDRKIKAMPDYTVDTYIDFEYDDKNFNPIDRFRYIEYDRDWSYDPLKDTRLFNDNILNAGVKATKNNNNKVSYDFSSRERGEQVSGSQHRLALNKSLGNLQLRSKAFKLSNNTGEIKSSWEQLSADLSYKTPWLISGYRFSNDHNVVTLPESDSVSSSAMFFDEHKGYIRNLDNSKVKFIVEYAYREDQRPLSGEMQRFSTSQTSKLSVIRSYGNNQLTAVMNYRTLKLKGETREEETVSGRLDWSGNWFNKHLKSELTYAVSNGRELRREFVYIRVPAGQGTHTWRDLNEDEVQDLTEFFEAINPDERNYAKIFTPGREFVTAFQNLLIYRVNLQMPRSWRKEGGIRGLLAKFSNNTSWTTDLKTTDSDLKSRLIGFLTELDENLVLTERSNLRSTFFFNRLSSTFGMEGVFIKQRSKQLLTNGFESRDKTEYGLNVRYNFSRRLSLRTKSSLADKSSDSDFLNGRQFKIETINLNPEISWQPNLKLRLSAQYQYQDKVNVFTSESDEYAIFHEMGVQLKYNKAIKNSLNASFRITAIDFNGEENSPLGYELLQALRPGSNYLWSLNWQQKITGGLQLNVIYDGRKSENTDVIHVGRMQVSALF
ncbi:MAG: hypothetical protein AAF519_00960 [Bacteroidota bacterium]